MQLGSIAFENKQDYLFLCTHMHEKKMLIQLSWWQWCWNTFRFVCVFICLLLRFACLHIYHVVSFGIWPSLLSTTSPLYSAQSEYLRRLFFLFYVFSMTLEPKEKFLKCSFCLQRQFSSLPLELHWSSTFSGWSLSRFSLFSPSPFIFLSSFKLPKWKIKMLGKKIVKGVFLIDTGLVLHFKAGD